MQSQPASPSLFGTFTELGQLKAEFPHNTVRLILPIVTFGFFCNVLGCGLIAQLKSQPLSILGGVVLTALLLGFIYRSEFQGRFPYAAALYEKGFACLGGSGLIQVHWEDIDKLENMVGESITIESPFVLTMEGTESHYYSIGTKNGMNVVLTEKILHVEKLWAAIQEGVASSKGEVAVKG